MKSGNFLIGTVKKDGTDLSFAKNPATHMSLAAARLEATRLLQIGAIAADRKCVIVEVRNLLSISANPIIIE